METTIQGLGLLGLSWGYIGIMEKKRETTIMGLCRAPGYNVSNHVSRVQTQELCGYRCCCCSHTDDDLLP